LIENGLVRELLFLIDTAYDRTSWHGPNLRGAIRGVTPEQARWRPAAGRHNIWELTVHAAYWKYVAWRRLTGARRGSFPIEGSNWLDRPRTTPDSVWRADLALLDQTHRTLRDAVAALSERALTRTPKGSKVNTLALLTGIAAHDLYHAGQIQLLKRLMQGTAAR
jgi:uncharacterized damage-inducible protein DinB